MNLSFFIPTCNHTHFSNSNYQLFLCAISQLTLIQCLSRRSFEILFTHISPPQFNSRSSKHRFHVETQLTTNHYNPRPITKSVQTKSHPSYITPLRLPLGRDSSNFITYFLVSIEVQSQSTRGEWRDRGQIKYISEVREIQTATKCACYRR